MAFYRIASILLSVVLLAGLEKVIGRPEGSSETTGLQSTMQQIGQMENIKLESISGFLVALFTMIGVIAKAVVQVIAGQVRFDMGQFESALNGLGGSNFGSSLSNFLHSITASQGGAYAHTTVSS